jgi:hypothetical protein
MGVDVLWAGLLLVSYYGVGLGLGGLCFLAIHYTTGAAWSSALRRVAETLAATLPLALVLLLVVLVARPQLYAWTTAGFVGAGGELAFKRFWLSRPFFLIRALVYALVWTAFALAMRRSSARQVGQVGLVGRVGLVGLSAAFLAVFAITFTLASIDWIMSLEPVWYSSIFGVYNFAGLFLSGLAAITLGALRLERTGPLKGVLTEEHLHDLGKLMFAFSIFWMYIWFSQYMLIWYTNIPEETSYFVLRGQGVWFGLSLLNVLLNWIVPFAMLLRRDAKRRRTTLALVAAVVLAGRVVDLYLMIFPSVAR